MPEKKIYDEEFDTALKNTHNAKIMNKVCGFYKNIIPKEDLHRCKLVALWKALVKFDPSCGQKFTSYLYNSIKWECQKELYVINKYRRGLTYNDDLSECFDEDLTEILDAISTLSPKLQDAIKQRFFYGLTMEEIGKKNNYSRETARRYVKRGLEKLKDICKTN
tara:strand:- start:473 stop:964 length:492 start_codon:yes stop_codon:yes gene_type:complete